MSAEVVLVVATTSDYIEEIRLRHPGRALFLTARPVREEADEPVPAPIEEIVCDLDHCPDPTNLILHHLDRWSLKLEGITCFDCESLPLTAHLAQRLDLAYASPETVVRCRSKDLTKDIWESRGIPCPRGMVIRNLDEALEFQARIAGPVILKPTIASGSEGVFACHSETDLRSAYDTLMDMLPAKPRITPGYPATASPEGKVNILAEELVSGEEYSSDFLLEETEITLIRFAHKEVGGLHLPGTALAYHLPAPLPTSLDRLKLLRQLKEAARCLGLRRALVMADFIIHDQKAVMLEIAPRPGGDCLPLLIHSSCGLDMLGLALDFAAGRSVAIPPAEAWRPLVGRRILADRPGILLRTEPPTDTTGLDGVTFHMKAKPGHKIALPPLDYGSWELGYIVYAPGQAADPFDQGRDLAARMTLEIGSDAPEEGDTVATAIPRLQLQKHIQSFLDRRQQFLGAAQVHGSPLYLLEPNVLVDRVRHLRAALTGISGKTRMYYALKSNSHPAVIKTLLAQGVGLDVSSSKELSTALSLGAERIVFTGPGKGNDDLDMALRYASRVTINVDSFGELERLQNRCAKLRTKAGIGVRIADQSCTLWRKFGIPLEELVDFFDTAADTPDLRVRGLHFHHSWQTNPWALGGFLDRMGDTLKKLPHEYRRMLSFLDIGGGFWPERGEWLHTPDGACPEPDAPLSTTCNHYCRRGTPLVDFIKTTGRKLEALIAPWIDVETWVEPGRWLCTDAMHVLLRVVDKKATDVVITDGGTNAIGRERLEPDYLPIINLTRPSMEEHPCYIYGSLCTPYDVWGYSYWGDGIAPGDYLLLPMQGAYTYSLRQEFIRELPKMVTMSPKLEWVTA